MTQLELFPKEIYPWITIEQRCTTLAIAKYGIAGLRKFWSQYVPELESTPEILAKTNPQRVYDYLMNVGMRITMLIEDENGELVLPLGDDDLAELNWQIGDTVKWAETSPGTWTITKVLEPS